MVRSMLIRLIDKVRPPRDNCVARVHVSVSDLWSGLPPRGCVDGRLAMLWAYFDDSGSHADTSLVVHKSSLSKESERCVGLAATTGFSHGSR
jgi:hypothetical protein